MEFLIVVFVVLVILINLYQNLNAKSGKNSRSQRKSGKGGNQGGGGAFTLESLKEACSSSERNAAWMRAAGKLNLTYLRPTGGGMFSKPSIAGRIGGYDVFVDISTADNGTRVTTYRINFPKSLNLGLLASNDNPELRQTMFSGRKKFSLEKYFSQLSDFVFSADEETDFQKFLTFSRRNAILNLMGLYPGVTITDNYILLRCLGTEYDDERIVRTVEHLAKVAETLYSGGEPGGASEDDATVAATAAAASSSSQTVIPSAAPLAASSGRVSKSPVYSSMRREEEQKKTDSAYAPFSSLEGGKKEDPSRISSRPSAFLKEKTEKTEPVLGQAEEASAGKGKEERNASGTALSSAGGTDEIPAFPKKEAGGGVSESRSPAAGAEGEGAETDLLNAQHLSEKLFQAAFPGQKEKDLFESVKGRRVCWKGTLKSAYDYHSDFVFGHAPGVRAVFDLCEVSRSSIKTRVRAVVSFPPEAMALLKGRNGAEFAFSGELGKFEGFSKEIYLFHAELVQ